MFSTQCPIMGDQVVRPGQQKSCIVTDPDTFSFNSAAKRTRSRASILPSLSSMPCLSLALNLNLKSWMKRLRRGFVSICCLLAPYSDHVHSISQQSAFRVVDALATALPPSQVFNPLYDLVKTYAQSPDPSLRKSALTSLGLSVEGCSEYIRPQVRTLWPYIDAGLADPVPVVRSAACIAFGCLCEWLPDECKERHAALLPVRHFHFSSSAFMTH